MSKPLDLDEPGPADTITLRVPGWLIRQIDVMASAQGVTRSAFWRALACDAVLLEKRGK